MIKKNLIVTIYDIVEEGAETSPIVHLKTMSDGNIAVEAIAPKFAVSPEDLQDALDELNEFMYDLDNEFIIQDSNDKSE